MDFQFDRLSHRASLAYGFVFGAMSLAAVIAMNFDLQWSSVAALPSVQLQSTNSSVEAALLVDLGRQDCAGLLAQDLLSPDIHECIVDRKVPMVVNAFCRDAACDLLVQNSSTYQGSRHPIAIITVDTRKTNPVHTMWQSYANEHGYTYLSIEIVGTSRTMDEVMLADSKVTGRVLEAMQHPAVRHIDLFMYTELDQWVVRPHALLEPVFEKSGLISGEKVVAVVEEYPCKNIRNGGNFNMGNFLFRRGQSTVDIFNTWMNSKAYKDDRGIPHWPARQGAFSVDVYVQHKSQIAVMAGGCPLGSPFGAVISHLTGGTLDKIYDPGKARPLLPYMAACVVRRLQTHDPRPCSLYPPWVGGQCLWCHRSMHTQTSGGEAMSFTYEACCGEDDSTMAVEILQEAAADVADWAFSQGKRHLHLGSLYVEGPPLCPGFEKSCRSFKGQLTDHGGDDLEEPLLVGFPECEAACKLQDKCRGIAWVCQPLAQWGLCYLKSNATTSGQTLKVCFKIVRS
mmetsp:Transcript_102309/g.259855  ORF Transcript_102309/g.259855 Transcript_102309/m.259855 type:complete len:511 (+) Transcript_102309:48-1580(+)